MKKYYLLSILVLSQFFYGCDDLLDVEVYSSLTSQNMWKSESEVQAGVYGAYDRFRSVFNGDSYLNHFELRSGFWKVGTSGAQQYNDLFYNTMNATSSPGINWSGYYTLINDANFIIKYAPTVTWSSEDNLGNCLADAYFIRAYTYFALARIYGDVPLVLTPTEKDEDIYPARESVENVFTQIFSDIKSALTNLHDMGVRSRVFASVAAINMLKTDALLWKVRRMNGGESDLQDALTAVNSVLENTSYQLEEDYATIFRDENSKECIFNIYFALTESGNQYASNFLCQSSRVTADFRNVEVPVLPGAQWLTFGSQFTDNYQNPADTRSIVNYSTFYDKKKKTTHVWINKYLGEVIDGTRENISDTRIYRLAEAYMFKAEILNELERTSEAIDVLNEVIERAYGTDAYYDRSMSKEEANDILIKERIIEFAAEGKSWFDIIRFGKAFELIPSLIGREDEHEGNILLFPVAQSTAAKNHNIELTPGYEQ